jgi:DNA-binding winged helix-turn-helix (wHTH) protein
MFAVSPMKLEFGECLMDFGARQLWRNGVVQSLEPKMYQLLEVLIKRRPGVVTNNELDELLWPKVYVERTSLTRLVSELRAVLGDTPRDSKIIRTVYKIGYAFCAEVSVPGSGGPALASAVQIVWQDQVMPLLDGEHIAGRSEDCSLIIDGTTVSRRHARITVRSGVVTIEDLGSTNGTHVNGVRITAPTVLTIDNRVELGSELLLIKRRSSSALTVRIPRAPSDPGAAPE